MNFLLLSRLSLTVQISSILDNSIGVQLGYAWRKAYVDSKPTWCSSYKSCTNGWSALIPQGLLVLPLLVRRRTRLEFDGARSETFYWKVFIYITNFQIVFKHHFLIIGGKYQINFGGKKIFPSPAPRRPCHQACPAAADAKRLHQGRPLPAPNVRLRSSAPALWQPQPPPTPPRALDLPKFNRGEESDAEVSDPDTSSIRFRTLVSWNGCKWIQEVVWRKDDFRKKSFSGLITLPTGRRFLKIVTSSSSWTVFRFRCTNSRLRIIFYSNI